MSVAVHLVLRSRMRPAAAILCGNIEIVSRSPADVKRRATRGARLSGRDGEEALEVGAFGEADGVVDGVAGAVDLSHTASHSEVQFKRSLPQGPV